MFMSVLCSVMFSFLYLSILVMFMSVLFSVIFSFFVFSNVHACFMFCHDQFFVFVNFSNVIQVLVVHLNLQVYLIVFVFIGYVLVLWYFVLQFFSYFSILVMFLKCSWRILIYECNCLFLFLLLKGCSVFFNCIC